MIHAGRTVAGGVRRWGRRTLALAFLGIAITSIVLTGGPLADPGTVVFWGLVGAGGWWLTRRWAAPPRARVRGPHGTPPPDQVCCGWGPDGWEVAPPQAATLVLGPPRSGKTRGVLIPNVAAWAGPVLVTSTRRDVLDATRAARRLKGICWVFDPLGVVDPLPPTVYRLVWSPLHGGRDWDVARRRAAALAVDTGRGITDATHWRTRATQLLAVVLHAAACGERDMATVCAWVHAQRAEPAQALATAPQAQAVLAGLLRTPDRERGSIWSAAQGILAPFDTAQVCAAADATPVVPFDPAVFLAGPHTVYVVSPSDAPTDGAPLVVGLVEEVREAARARSDAEGALPLPWLLALDEAATICPLPALPRLLAEGGGRNVVTLVALQDLRQAAERWGPATAQSFLTLAGTKVLLPGLADAETLAALETLVGRTWVPQTTTSTSRSRPPGPWWRGDETTTQSTQHGWVEQPILPASRWRTGPPGTAWVLTGADAPVRVTLIDPDTTPPFAAWLRPEPGRL
ncbi:MAG TPA: type IV secretory system conjugative DNA transfer family protein [Verrucomicrobiae bacterium]|nr:type IV secretory system conjugative DNA transfer family protein [Verrucomicrobiae bacterium]